MFLVLLVGNFSNECQEKLDKAKVFPKAVGHFTVRKDLLLPEVSDTVRSVQTLPIRVCTAIITTHKGLNYEHFVSLMKNVFKGFSESHVHGHLVKSSIHSVSSVLVSTIP